MYAPVSRSKAAQKSMLMPRSRSKGSMSSVQKYMTRSLEAEGEVS